jgi:hypothetical protein
MATKIANGLSILLGVGLIFLGSRFLIAPETGEAGFGIHFNEQGDYSFHYIKGIRDIFAGLVISLLFITKQNKALRLALICGAVIPSIDLLIVFSKDYTGMAQAMPHIIAIFLCLSLGLFYFVSKTGQIPLQQ